MAKFNPLPTHSTRGESAEAYCPSCREITPTVEEVLISSYLSVCEVCGTVVEDCPIEDPGSRAGNGFEGVARNGQHWSFSLQGAVGNSWGQLNALRKEKSRAGLAYRRYCADRNCPMYAAISTSIEALCGKLSLDESLRTRIKEIWYSIRSPSGLRGVHIDRDLARHIGLGCIFWACRSEGLQISAAKLASLAEVDKATFLRASLKVEAVLGFPASERQRNQLTLSESVQPPRKTLSELFTTVQTKNARHARAAETLCGILMRLKLVEEDFALEDVATVVGFIFLGKFEPRKRKDLANYCLVYGLSFNGNLPELHDRITRILTRLAEETGLIDSHDLIAKFDDFVGQARLDGVLTTTAYMAIYTCRSKIRRTGINRYTLRVPINIAIALRQVNMNSLAGCCLCLLAWTVSVAHAQPDLDDRSALNYIGVPAFAQGEGGAQGRSGASAAASGNSINSLYNQFQMPQFQPNKNWYSPELMRPNLRGPPPIGGPPMMPPFQGPPLPQPPQEREAPSRPNDGSVLVGDLTCTPLQSIVGLSNDRNHWLSTVECECRMVTNRAPEFSCYSLCDAPRFGQRCEASFSILNSCPTYKNCANWLQSNSSDSGAISCTSGVPVPEAVCWILASAALRDDDTPLRPAFYANAAAGCSMSCLCGNDGTIAGEFQCLKAPTSKWRFPIYPRTKKFDFSQNG
ncbi:hypothetical protein BV898_11144 [Hypsibius exemplaris]|uniref:TFIIB-type domain-containing protein n=1 Tax=Hypsibius exemplaris TaxID=2072580 RepID=A0A1W0WHF7_HYPEX|nr:hypothetical protein BV898_11144 [Hypsibius exemplaris]